MMESLIKTPAAFRTLGKKNLPTIPQILIKLIRLFHHARDDIREVSDIIRLDPALAFKVLERVHSKKGPIHKKVLDMESAVAEAGIETIREMVNFASIHAAFELNDSESFLRLRGFWEHSLQSAFLAQIISKEARYPYPDVAFLTALLHDIGKLILLSNFPDTYKELFSSRQDLEAFSLLERETIGVNHCRLAAWLIDQWDFHTFASDAVFYHHYPAGKVVHSSPLVRIIYLSNLLTAEHGGDQGEKALMARDLMGFDEGRVAGFVNEATDRFKETAAFLGMDPESLEPADGRSDISPVVHRSLARAVALQAVHRAEGRDAIIKAAKQGLQNMIGVSDAMFFLYSPEEDALIHFPDEDDTSPEPEKLSIPLHLDQSILVSSLFKGEPVDSFTQFEQTEPILLDSQIIHLMGKEGIVCLPMLDDGLFVGVIVLGMDRVELPFFSDQAGLISRFARAVSSIWKRDQTRQERIDRSQSDRLEASVLRTRKIVHEINNPLGIIKNYLKVLNMKLAEKDMAYEEIGIINEEISRIGNMLRTLTSPPDQPPYKEEPTRINFLFSDLIKLTSGSLSRQSGIRIHLDSDPSVPEAKIQKDSLKQILMNLIKNAAEAMPGGGNIYIKTRYLPAAKEPEQQAGRDGTRDMIEISISDDGPGISDEIKNALFDPFVTSTKGHNGLGLSIVSDLVHRMNGSIDCTSDKGKGTSFRIRLPLVTQG